MKKHNPTKFPAPLGWGPGAFRLGVEMKETQSDKIPGAFKAGGPAPLRLGVEMKETIPDANVAGSPTPLGWASISENQTQKAKGSEPLLGGKPKATATQHIP